MSPRSLKPHVGQNESLENLAKHGILPASIDSFKRLAVNGPEALPEQRLSEMLRLSTILGHPLEQAVPSVTHHPDTACAKQWHTMARDAGKGR